MSDDQEQEEKKDDAPSGAPAWMATFADLMSLLMCFFVLLLSFSEMDVLKYKQVAGSMESAFGVQRLVESSAIPKGTSIIAQEFSPGRPDPTPIKQVQQITVDDTRQTVDLLDRGQIDEDETNKKAQEVAELMVDEIKDGKVDVEVVDGKIIIRIREYGSFSSGSANLAPSFLPVIEKIRMVLAETEGKVQVSGHTDDIPIATDRFRSNWELSASRAVSVAHALLATDEIDWQRFSVTGFADTEPLAANDSPKNRAMNRRVEVVITPTAEKDKDDTKLSMDNSSKNSTVKDAMR